MSVAIVYMDEDVRRVYTVSTIPLLNTNRGKKYNSRCIVGMHKEICVCVINKKAIMLSYNTSVKGSLQRGGKNIYVRVVCELKL